MANVDPPKDLRPDECREPTLEDLTRLCHALNEAGARYVVVGGFAIRAAGFARNTMDVDLLVQTGVENETLVIKALMTLPDRAVREIKPGDVDEYGVIRVADEILIDLMKTACGVDYAAGIADAVYHEIEGVRIPFASPQTLWRMKQTYRDKDIADRFFLHQWLSARGISVDQIPPATSDPRRG